MLLHYWSPHYPNPKFKGIPMPKMKTHKGAAKRFKRTASGSFKRNASHRRHILTKKSTKRKRQLRSPSTLHSADVAMARRMIPYA